MIYSQWQPDGGYDYYESEARHPIGDDMPVASMPAPAGGIGVPAQDAGYPLPSDARYVGSGDAPVGIITPMSRASYKGLSGSGTKELGSNEIVVVLFLVGALAAAAIADRMGK